MQSKKVLINMTNIHVGGAVQVAVSFIYELSKMDPENFDFSYDLLLSSTILTELKQQKVDLGTTNFEVVDVFGLRALLSGIERRFNNYNLVFTMFGPGYFLPNKCENHLVGFAQAWIIYPDNEFWKQLALIDRYLLRIKFWIQSLFFKQARHLVVELEHVEQGLIQAGIMEKENISVVYNSVSSLYFHNEQWQTIDFEFPKNKILIGLVSRDYPHKNIDVLPEVAVILKKQYGLSVCFVLTLSDNEWAKRSQAFKEHVVSVGAISSNQCPTFYQALDGVIFPSFLESFSISPLEALVMGKPLFASDRGFVRDVCSEYAYYFDPNNGEDIAHAIAAFFTNKVLKYCPDKAKNHVINFSNSMTRANGYMKLISRILNE